MRPVSRILRRGVYFNFEVISMTDNSLLLHLYDTNNVIVNELRKISKSEVRIFAIKDINIFNNDSKLSDESLAFRIRRVPIWSNHIDLLDQEHRSDVEHRYEINVVNNSDIDKYVTSNDIIQVSNLPEDIQRYRVINDDGSVTYPGDVVKYNEEEQLTILTPGTDVRIECRATPGKYSTGEKVWSPIASCVTNTTPIITILPNILNVDISERKIFVESCRFGVYSMNDDGLVDIEDINACTLCGVCTSVLDDRKQEPFVRFDYPEDQFKFHIESRGSLTAGRIFTEAVKIAVKTYKIDAGARVVRDDMYSIYDIIDGSVVLEASNVVEEGYI